MKASGVAKGKKNRRLWIPILVVVLLAAAGAGIFIWNRQSTAAAQAESSSINTSTVRKGSITISVSGSGTLIAGKEKALSFSTAGKVAAVNVQTGDRVSAGQTLAEMGELEELKAAVNSAQQEQISAQKALQTLQSNAAVNLANAQLELAAAQKAVIDAKDGLITTGMSPCDQETIDSYYYRYTKAVDALNALGDGGGNYDYYLNTIVPAKNKAAAAYSTYESCIRFTDYEITSSQATLSLEQANLKLAQATLDTLQANNGLDPLELAQAETSAAAAQLALDTAKEKLAGTTLTAPFDGTILAVAGSAGDEVGTDTFITIADLAHPQVEFSIDETDMAKVSAGIQANVTFDALPDLVFTGTVTRINPALETSNNYKVVTGLIQLDLSQMENPPELRKSLTASVELVQASAKDVMLVPLQAVRDLGDGKYGLFVIGQDGKPRLAFVEVGLMDAASAEIKSGVSVGDTVSTGSDSAN